MSPYENEKGNSLPEGWAASTLPDICAINMGQSPPGTSYNDCAQGYPFFQGKADFGDRYPAVRKWCTEPKKIAKPGDVLISIRAPVGPTNVADRECVIGRGLAALTPSGGTPAEIVLFGLRLQEPELSLTGTGSTFTAINRSDLDRIEIPLAPLAEQKRIVAKVEALLARVNAARGRLAKVPAILKRFRQAVLANACSGKLTEDWRREHPADRAGEQLLKHVLSLRETRFRQNNTGRYRNPVVPVNGKGYELPHGWAVASMDQLTCLVTSGSRGWAKFYADAGALFIRAQNINTDQLRLNDTAHVRPPSSAEDRRTKVERDDLLVTITGANVTKSARVHLDLDEAYVSQHVALVRPVDTALAPFLFLWTVSPTHGRRKLENDAYGAGKPGLNLDNIRKMVVGIPPLEEQREIVRCVEALFKLADAIEKRVEAARVRPDKLTQSILAKAFRGELVPTEAELARQEGRDYEPASVLLERIRVERATAGEKSKTRRRPKREPTRPKPPVKPARAETAEPQQPTLFDTLPKETTPAARPPSVDDLSTEEVLAAFRQASRGRGQMTRDELIRQVASRLGYQRLGSAIRQRLKGHLRAAIRRRIVGADGDTVWPETPRLDDYTRDELVDAIRSVTRKGCNYEREELIQMVARHLGFARLREQMRAPINSAINAAIRRGIIEYKGKWIRRGS